MQSSTRVGLFLAMLVAACSSTAINTASPAKDAAAEDAGGATGAADAALLGDAPPAGSATDATAEATDAAAPLDGPPPLPPKCEQTPVPQPGARSIATVAIDLTYAGKPVPYGQVFPLPGGGSLTVSNFRFFLSDVTMVRAGAEPVPVDIVGREGKPVTFNVHLVNAEDPAQMIFQIAVPPGDYTGLSFIFGINDACNARAPSVAPLDYQSQLSWPSPFGFLFLRYEGVVTGAATKDPLFPAVAMGGVVGYYGAPRVTATGALQVTAAPASAHLHVALDQIFRAADMPADLTDKILPGVPPPGGSVPGLDEITLGEHVRQNAPKVPIFSLTTAP